MLKIAAIYGAIAGSITIAVMCVGFVLDSKGLHGASSAVFGYAVMIVALTMIFIGIKRYRDQSLGGVIKFAPAFGLGLAIAAIAAVFYSTGWEIYLAATDYAFAENYANAVIAKKEAAGLAGAELDKVREAMASFVDSYKNPFYRFPMTTVEIFPVGFLVALASAALLRNPKVFPAR
ncbi:DUF4199 domain-containing protein [Hyphococcus sp.]|uniref:DUF4199 domain-containing protein n=1 Tax=Hyphococcus sp. TaxID=2038636 RepID=UPI002087DD8A|nr:MAG: hypothetical protein DHS20C04_02770 [Marinicaulis sp.]